MHHLIQRAAAAAALLICLLAGSAALAQESSEPPPPPPPPDKQQQSPRDAEQTERTERREDTRRNAAAGEAVRQRKRGISPLRYGLGGLVGTFYGLGIGHAISGEWSNHGWIFTVGELGSAALMVYGISQELQRNSSGLGSNRGEVFILAGAAAFTIFRVYEVIDVWTRPTVASVDKPVDTAFAVGPVGQKGGLGALLQLRW